MLTQGVRTFFKTNDQLFMFSERCSLCWHKNKQSATILNEKETLKAELESELRF